MGLQRHQILTAKGATARVEESSRGPQLRLFFERLGASRVYIEGPSNLTARSSGEMIEFGIVCLWALIGIAMSIFVGTFGGDIASVLAVAG